MFSASSQPGCKSQLYNAICSYLHNQSRAQPIIGLNSITEMWTHNQPAVYFCDVCFLRISKADIRNHIMGSLHRYNYIKSHHAHGWRSYTDLTVLARPLMDIAKIVETKEGTGDVQVQCVDEVIYREMISCPVPAAFAKLKSKKNQQNPKVLQSFIYNNPVEGNKTNVQALQECESRAPSTSPPRRTPSPVAPLSISQEGSSSRNLMGSHVSDRILNLESSLAPALSQHSNQNQPVIQERNQSPQRFMMPPETRSPHISISVDRPLRNRTLIRMPCQNDTVHFSEEDGNGVIHLVGVESHSLRPATTNDPYRAQLQTSPLRVSHMLPEITQSLTSRQEIFRNESLTDSPEPTSAFELTSKPIIKQRLTGALKPAFTLESNRFLEPDFQEPISTDWEAHVTVEAQSQTLVEENITLSSQNSPPQSQSTQTQNPPVLIQSSKDSPESYTGRKPLIGLQAVIKCQSVDGDPPPCCYLCQLCSVKVKKKKIISHLTGCLHQCNYLKVLHPQLLPDMKRKRCNINEMLEDIAMQMEKKDGKGQIKVMRLSACLISEVLQRDYHWCMKVLNCEASVGSFSGGTDQTTGPSQALKRPAESVLSPVDNDGAPLPTHQRSKKKKKGYPKIQVMCANTVKEPVFKVSLSLQQGPVVIERTPLRNTVTVAPEIEHQTLKSTYTENDELALGNNTHTEVQPCNHGCPQIVCDPAEYWNTPHDGNMLTQANIPTLTYTHTEVISHIQGRMYGNQFMSPAQYAHTGQFDHAQLFPVVQPSCRRKDYDSLEEVVSVSYADWPVQDWSFSSNEWVLQRQNTGDDTVYHPEFASYIQY